MTPRKLDAHEFGPTRSPVEIDSIAVSKTPVPDHPPTTPLLDVPALLTRPVREAPLPSVRREPAERLLDRFGTDPATWPAFPARLRTVSTTGSPLAALALGTPDLFLIGYPEGGNPTPLLNQLVREALAQGGRTLLLVSKESLADSFAMSWLEQPGCVLGRALAPHERLAALPQSVAACTATALAERDRNLELRERTERLHQLESQLAMAREQLNARQRLAELEQRAQTLQTERDELPETLRNDSQTQAEWERPLAERKQTALAELEDRVRTLDESRQQVQQELETLKCQAPVSPPRVGGFFKKLFAGKAVPTVSAPPPDRLAEAERHLQTLGAEVEACHHRRSEIESEFRQSCQRLEREEIARRQQKIDAQLASLEAELQPLRERIASEPVPDLQRLQADFEQAQELLRELEIRPLMPSRASLQVATLVVGPLAALGFDPYLQPTHPEADPNFDRLIVLGAEQIDEAEFLTAAKLASTWVLLGQRPPATNLKPYRNGKPLPRGGFFEWAWLSLDARPFREQGEQLVVQLAAVPPERRSTQTREPLADRPEIELHFHETETGSIELAAVAFPRSLGVNQAQAFLATELGEARFVGLGAMSWRSTSEEIVCCWPTVESLASQPESQVLKEGVSERTVQIGGETYTVSVSFALSAGWTRETAEAWLSERTISDLRLALALPEVNG